MEGKQISTKQFVAVQFLIALAVKMFMLPALMLRVIGKDSFFVMLIWIGVEFLNLSLLLIVACRNPDKTMFDILSDAFGKVGAKAVTAVLALFMLAKSVLILSELKMFFSVAMFDEINWHIMIVPVLALLVAFGLRSLRVFGRTAEIIAPIVIVCTVLLAVLLLDDLKEIDLLPLLENGFGPVGEGLMTFPMWFGDITFLALYLGNIKINKGFCVGALLSKLAAALFVMLFSSALFSTYANIGTLIDYGHNISNMTQFSMGSQDFGRFDLIFYCVWLMSVFMKLAAVFLFLTRCVGFIFGTRNNYVTGILCAVALYVVCELILSNENVVFAFYTSAVKFVLVPPALLLPALLLVICLIKYKPNYRRGKGKGAPHKEEKEESGGQSQAEKQSASA